MKFCRFSLGHLANTIGLGVSFFSILGAIFASQKVFVKLGGSFHCGATPQRVLVFLGSPSAALGAMEKANFNLSKFGGVVFQLPGLHFRQPKMRRQVGGFFS